MDKRVYLCPAEMTLDLISGKWKIIVLWLLRKGPQRSGKLKSKMPGITSTAFSKAVRELEAAGLLRRTCRGSEPPAVSYGLTAKGESLAPIVRALVRWGITNQAEYVLGEFGMAPSLSRAR